MPPVNSPLPLQALLAGAIATVRGFDPEPVVKKIESEYSPMSILLTDSGTSALRLALESIHRGGRPSVALPAYSCYDLLSAARGAEVDVVFYDVDPKTLGPRRSSLVTALESGVGAVVIAHLYGVPIDVGAVRDQIAGRDILLIEDAAQGVGGEMAGRALGGAGDLAILSFSRGKGRTGGAGGGLLAHTEPGRRAVERLGGIGSTNASLRTLCASAAQWLFARPGIYGLPAAIPALALGETRYREPKPAYSMSGVSAAVLSASWEAAAAEVRARRECGEAYATALSGIAGMGLVEPPSAGRAGYLRFPVLVDHPIPARKAEVLERLGAVRGYPKILAEVEARSTDRSVDALEGARRLVETLWTLPAHRWVTPGHRTRIVDLLATS